MSSKASGRDLYVWLPPEAGLAAGWCAKLLRTLYGCKDAGQNFEFTVTDVCTDGGYAQGIASPCIYYCSKNSVRVVVHSDDFFVLGTRATTLLFRNTLAKHFSVKDRGVLGPDPSKGDVQQIIALNRLVRYEPEKGPVPARIE